MTNILVLGGGGREHALAWKLAQDPEVSRIVCAPGNGGIAEVAECLPCDIEDPVAVVALARQVEAGFVVIGPEAPLAAGVADALGAEGIAHFGPSRAAARLEASKAFAKTIVDAVGAPTARWRRFDALEPAVAYVEAEGAPIVVKADGLAAGKGVTVAESVAEAVAALESVFDAPGAAVVIEERMTGPEASLFALCDGEAAIEFGWAQDHKRAFDGDAGPNTGGMGAYSPAPVLTSALREDVMARIVRPVIAEMARRGAPFRGVLYVGLMLTADGPKLVEFNTRFGDPEGQVLMMRLASPLLPLLRASAEGGLAAAAPEWRDEAAAAVVLAAKGYPGGYAKGEPIGGLEAAAALEGVQLFHAGTRSEDGRVLSNGGRVLNVCALGADLPEALRRAYAAVAVVDWPGGFHRRDIGAGA